MIELDVADLVVIASHVTDIGTDATLAQIDIAAAEAALAEARLAGQQLASAAGSHRSGGAPAAAAALMHALLRHAPVHGHRERVAVAAGLQLLAVNGWQAHLDVPTAAVIIIERLASGRLTPADVASWLAPRLSPHPVAPARQAPMRALLPPGSRARRIILAPVAAVRHRQRRQSRPGPFLIIRGSGDQPGGIRTPATGFMPFTRPARSSVVLSGQEDRRLGHNRPDCCPEHILLGLIGEGGGVAASALERLGVSREAIRQRVEQVTVQGEPQTPTVQAPDTPKGRRVWHAAVDEAVAHGDDYIGTEHFLLGLFCDSDGGTAQALARLGAGENEVRAAIAAVLAESGRERSAL